METYSQLHRDVFTCEHTTVYMQTYRDLHVNTQRFTYMQTHLDLSANTQMHTEFTHSYPQSQTHNTMH